MDLNCTLLLASGAAYNIHPSDGRYTPDILFSKNVDFHPPGPIVLNSTGSRLNACLVGKTSAGIVVAFRGTLTSETWAGLYDSLEDLFAEPCPCDGFPGKVHSGFCADLKAIYPQVLEAVNRLDSGSDPVYVTGHSKGGALASLCAYALRQDGIAVTQVVTFASPKAGDSAFKAGYERVIRNQVRYENYGDIVPFVPPAGAFVELLADVVGWLPDIGPSLAKLICEAADWDYQPVGVEWYINKTHTVVHDESAFGQLTDLATNLGSGDPLTALGNAHSLYCTFGYMSGTCPSSICTST